MLCKGIKLNLKYFKVYKNIFEKMKALEDFKDRALIFNTNCY